MAETKDCWTGGHNVHEEHCKGGERCPAGLPTCHVAVLCRRCDRQWINPCDEHVEAAA